MKYILMKLQRNRARVTSKNITIFPANLVRSYPRTLCSNSQTTKAA